MRAAQSLTSLWESVSVFESVAESTPNSPAPEPTDVDPTAACDWVCAGDCRRSFTNVRCTVWRWRPASYFAAFDQPRQLQRYCSSCCDECLSCGDSILPRRRLCDGCEDTHFICDYCEQAFSRDDAVSNTYGTLLCVECLHENHTYCRRCGGWERNGERCSPGWMYAYGEGPEVRFLRGATEPRQHDRLYFGWELEVEREGNDLPEPPDFAWGSNDGSLDDGVEYISHPMSWAWVKEHGAEVEGLLRDIARAGGESYNTDTCGMHVHLSKRAFTSLHLYKFMKLIYENPVLTLAVSQRMPEKLEAWAGLTKENPQELIGKALRKWGPAGRYVAVNLENAPTVEVRIFRGTLKWESFRKNLEFCHAAWAFSQAESLERMHSKLFVSWVGAEAKEYPNLNKFLQKRKGTICV